MIRNAYLIHQAPYAMPPAHLRDTMAWLCAHGFDAVSIAVGEIDFDKNAINLRRVFEAAKQAGLAVHAVPSRWGGIVAGVPGMFSRFCMENPSCLVLDADGRPAVRSSWGFMASIYAPQTLALFCGLLERLLALCPFDGIIWDEPKSFYLLDHSQQALAVRPPDGGLTFERAQVAAFYTRVCACARALRPGVYQSLFVYADSPPEVLRAAAGIDGLDCVGIDGNPFVPVRMTDKRGKTLVGTLDAVRSLAAAQGKQSMALIENFGLTHEENALMAASIDTVTHSGVDHLLAYYYGRNNEAPDETMRIVGEAFQRLAQG